MEDKQVLIRRFKRRVFACVALSVFAFFAWAYYYATFADFITFTKVGRDLSGKYEVYRFGHGTWDVQVLDNSPDFMLTTDHKSFFYVLPGRTTNYANGPAHEFGQTLYFDPSSWEGNDSREYVPEAPVTTESANGVYTAFLASSSVHEFVKFRG